MDGLKYVTRGMVEPNGKNNVYFCAHPKDVEKYLTDISNDILETQDCAIWYADGGVERSDDYLDRLTEMALFVIPVTANLLTNGAYVLEKEFPFAMKHRIPVLPVIVEGVSPSDFNEVIGDYQYLDRVSFDETAISYTEKLKKFLSYTLADEALIQRVKAAFDAYIFLSYRKKDRKYARELMKLIHKNDFCRDVAIWYDEFLNPGEDFNDSIKSALTKSSLFVLAVTPNLVNEKNYIMTTEYPLARAQGKEIFPAELVPTDRELLSQKYDGIPDCTDPADEKGFSEALFAALKDIAVRENDSSPEHLFFIGLAYLNGIDIETDREKGEALMIEAAEAGLPEAMERLAEMYAYGLGVKPDRQKALDWMYARLGALREAYEGEPSFENSMSLLEFCEDRMELSKLLSPFLVLELVGSRVDACESLGLRETDPERYMEGLLAKGDGYLGFIYCEYGSIIISGGEGYPEKHMEESRSAYLKLREYVREKDLGGDAAKYSFRAMLGLIKLYIKDYDGKRLLENLEKADNLIELSLATAKREYETTGDVFYRNAAIELRMRACLVAEEKYKYAYGVTNGMISDPVSYSYVIYPELGRFKEGKKLRDFKYGEYYSLIRERVEALTEAVVAVDGDSPSDRMVRCRAYETVCSFYGKQEGEPLGVEFCRLRADELKMIADEERSDKASFDVGAALLDLALAYDGLDDTEGLCGAAIEAFNILRRLYLKYGQRQLGFSVKYSLCVLLLKAVYRNMGNDAEAEKYAEYEREYDEASRKNFAESIGCLKKLCEENSDKG